MTNGGTTGQSGYYAAISSAGAWSMLRIDAGTSATALHFSGGSWQQVLSYDTSGDATRYTGAGNLAIEFRSSTIDDFGGGKI